MSATPSVTISYPITLRPSRMADSTVGHTPISAAITTLNTRARGRTLFNVPSFPTFFCRHMRPQSDLPFIPAHSSPNVTETARLWDCTDRGIDQSWQGIELRLFLFKTANHQVQLRTS